MIVLVPAQSVAPAVVNGPHTNGDTVTVTEDEEEQPAAFEPVTVKVVVDITPVATGF